ncbi:hypothetical protein [Streptomyces sp. NPDC003006]
MPNLPEDIVDRVKSLERQVRQLTTYINTRAAAPAGTAGAATGDQGDQGDQDDQTGQGQTRQEE